jgi:hypothetical protein
VNVKLAGGFTTMLTGEADENLAVSIAPAGLATNAPAYVPEAVPAAAVTVN